MKSGKIILVLMFFIVLALLVFSFNDDRKIDTRTYAEKMNEECIFELNGQEYFSGTRQCFIYLHGSAK